MGRVNGGSRHNVQSIPVPCEFIRRSFVLPWPHLDGRQQEEEQGADEERGGHSHPELCRECLLSK